MTGREALEEVVRVLERVDEGDVDAPSCTALAIALIDHLAHVLAPPLADRARPGHEAEEA